jgi:excisionase family DNA binding protein
MITAQQNLLHGRLLRPKQVAAQIGLSVTTVWALCRDGRLPHIRISKRTYLIAERDLDHFLATNRR